MQSKAIHDLIAKGEPAVIGKIGFSEMKVLYSMLTGHQLNQQDLHDIFPVAGVFPPNADGLQLFIEEMKNALPKVDILAKMCLDKTREDFVIEALAASADILSLRDLEPYYWDTPWSKNLEEKKILIISPFVDTIESQYKKREDLWEREIIPNMTLEYIKAPLSHYIKQSSFSSWKEALDDMKAQMRKLDFDVCLVGAGAWSLPLAVEAKALGKIGIHLGGPLQVLFGIKGRRWDDHDVISTFYNEHWVRPSKEESPDANTMVEGGCYW